MTTPSKDDLEATLANIRRSGLDHILKRPITVLPPGNALDLPPSYTARPTGKKGHRE